jgi:RimJ/RimL family protein N-acetyltransferase
MDETRLPFDSTETGLRALLPDEAILSAWRNVPPVLRGPRLTLREVRPSDAPALFALLRDDEVRRFATPPPQSVEAFERFIVAVRDRRAAGEAVCLAVVPNGFSAPVGVFQVRQLDAAFTVAEWGFALGAEFWGQGLFFAAAPLVVDLAFDVLGARRLEARVAVQNGRGNGALRKLGAQQEAVLRKSLMHNGTCLDQVLWGILADEWRSLGPARNLRVH